MYLDREMLKVVREGASDDRVIDCYEAVALFNAAADGKELTCCERWTLRFILSAYVFTDAAFAFIKEALAEKEGKLKYSKGADKSTAQYKHRDQKSVSQTSSKLAREVSKTRCPAPPPAAAFGRRRGRCRQACLGAFRVSFEPV